ncbi:hypothetical protein WN51_05266 [Melipona quadrifasciata]|uniref:Uncharacterized protein n=1 Tax=Melipona quadrifasciata TaxID=166423 RepID=A0A0M8ZW14_9HYME|nr:hypothetical protein WN51_05266 [Melipona quadrifasciata]
MYLYLTRSSPRHPYLSDGYVSGGPHHPDMGDVLLGQVIGCLIGFLNWNLME